MPFLLATIVGCAVTGTVGLALLAELAGVVGPEMVGVDALGVVGAEDVGCDGLVGGAGRLHDGLGAALPLGYGTTHC